MSKVTCTRCGLIFELDPDEADLLIIEDEVYCEDCYYAIEEELGDESEELYYED